MPACTAAASALRFVQAPFGTKSKKELSDAFVPVSKGHALEDWVGTYVDVFCPDYQTAERLPWDMNPASRRFIDLIDGQLCMSADHGDGNRWGRRFDPSKPGPVFTTTSQPAMRQTSLAVNVPPGAEIYADAAAGALTFNVTLGRAFGCSCLKWSTVYGGRGGKFLDQVVPPSQCDNFLVRVVGDDAVPRALYHEMSEHYERSSDKVGSMYALNTAHLAHGTMMKLP